jgi:hypothetical protein
MSRQIDRVSTPTKSGRGVRIFDFIAAGSHPPMSSAESREQRSDKMRVGLTIVGVCLLLSVVIAWQLKQKYGPEWASAQDVFMGLTYFMETHDGRLPESEAEFLESGFVERQPDGSIKIRPPATSKFNTKVHGIPIASLAPFRIRWGLDLSSLKVDDYGNARDAEQKKVEALSWPSSPPSGKAYTLLLIDVWKKIRG